MRILFTASEAYPLIKTGGLGDVAGALPPALARQGMDVRLLLPGYPAALAAAETPDNARAMRLGDLMGTGEATLVERRMPDTGLPVWLVDCPPLYDREGGPYIAPDGWDHHDNFQRFALLSRVAALIGQTGAFDGWLPDVVHANDWQTGLAPAYLAPGPWPRAPTVFTGDNAAYQGIFGPGVMDAVGLPAETYAMEGVEYFGHVSYLKAGAYYADHITAVSPTYAQEIQTAEQGCGLEGLFTERADDLTGILNGVDYAAWDPASDPLIDAPFDAESLDGKAVNKAAVQRAHGLPVRDDLPLLGMVGRITEQKGMDLLVEALDTIEALGAQVVVLGAGEAELERALAEAARERPETLAVRIGYDETLAHRIMAGSDAFLMPSRFEPCGLAQMYALRYGSVPVVRRTGGLADTVRDADHFSLGTGFVFDDAAPAALSAALARAVARFGDPAAFRAIQKRGMAEDFSWDRSAQEYVALYRQLV